jgi:pyrroline-5-carboxylate reductase
MNATIGIVGEGSVGRALGTREDVVVWRSLEDASATAGVVLVEGESVTTLSEVRAALGPGPALFRVAAGPDDGPCVGAIILCPEEGTAAKVVGEVAELLGGLGGVQVVAESLLPAASAAGRSSVGDITVALEGIEEGAVEAGLPRAAARAFVRQTLQATALLLQDHPGSPADLKDRVASPGGTTIAGLAVLEDAAVRGAFIRAVEEAAGQRTETVTRDQSLHD